MDHDHGDAGRAGKAWIDPSNMTPYQKQQKRVALMSIPRPDQSKSNLYDSEAKKVSLLFLLLTPFLTCPSLINLIWSTVKHRDLSGRPQGKVSSACQETGPSSSSQKSSSDALRHVCRTRNIERDGGRNDQRRTEVAEEEADSSGLHGSQEVSSQGEVHPSTGSHGHGKVVVSKTGKEIERDSSKNFC